MSINGLDNIFASDKILTISVADYLELMSRKATDYEAVGVHINGVATFDICGRYADIPFSPLEAFAKQVPQGAEVVVGYSTSVGGNQGNSPSGNVMQLYATSGTALIPKKK